jgi:hypothetical protein
MNTLQAIIAIIEGLTGFYPFHLPLTWVLRALLGMQESDFKKCFRFRFSLVPSWPL